MLSLFERIKAWWQARRRRTITPSAARERVGRGAAYLDGVDPQWYRRVNAETLELEDGRHCVLGQLHGEFRLGLGRSHLVSMSSAPRANLSPVAYGFKCVDGVSEDWQAYDYQLLNEAWRDAVLRRRAADPTRPDKEETVHAGDSMPEVPAEPLPSE